MGPMSRARALAKPARMRQFGRNPASNALLLISPTPPIGPIWSHVPVGSTRSLQERVSSQHPARVRQVQRNPKRSALLLIGPIPPIGPIWSHVPACYPLLAECPLPFPPRPTGPACATLSFSARRMPHLQPVHIISLALLILFALLARWLRSREPRFPYEPADALLTPAETVFWEVLVEAVGADFALFSKVRLADVIVVRPGLPNPFRMRAFNRISAKHLDFVVCDPESYVILGVIELDDRSHLQEARRDRDDFIDGALSAAGIPILHVPAQRAYSAAKLRDQVLDSLEFPGPTVAERH
jgi:hypothetical protein